MALSLLRYSDNIASKDSPSSLFHILKQRNQRERERCKAIVIENGDVLPEVVLVEILSWLPMKALLQFKTVCKSWYIIITSRQFISKHLNNYYNASHTDCLLVNLREGEDVYLVSLLVDQTPKVIATKVLPILPLDEPIVCGPCHGIYYIYSYHGGEHDRALWNPATNELKVLPLITKPNLPLNLYELGDESYGFAYDPVDEDYKVVIVKGYWSDDGSEVTLPLSLFIYSLKADSWRYWGDLAQKYYMVQNYCYMFLRECFYWLGSWNQCNVIISFDFATDSVQEIHAPISELPPLEDLPVQQDYCNILAIYSDSLAFLSLHEYGMRFEIWTWNEGLWTKILTMAPSLERLWHPIGNWKNYMFVVESMNRKLLLCDLETHELSDFGFHHGVICEGLFTYKESLVSIGGTIQELN